ncbi:MAG: tetratricopeptide repeat protein [Magnetococcales bacterium]|nr:tetratricopeptide repeat protein [Magnetococcales bacterium]
MTADRLARAHGLRAAGQGAAAERDCQGILAQAPDHPDALNLLGILTMERGDLVAGMALVERSNRAAPSAEKGYNLGLAAERLGDAAGAEAWYRQAVALDPRAAAAHNNLGVLLMERGDPAAGRHFDLALTADPGHHRAWINRGSLWRQAGRRLEAGQALQHALALAPDDPVARFNLGLLRLQQGDLAAGFRDYAWRYASGQVPLPPIRERPWNGEAPAGRVLLVQAEQGYGDTLNFLRFLHPLRRLGPREIHVTCPPPLGRLLAGFPAIDRLLAPGDPLPRFDWQVSLHDLPRLLGVTTMADLDMAGPGPTVDPALVARWRERVSGPAGRRVGLVWRGRADFAHDRFRSLSAARVAPLLVRRDIRFHGLVKEPAPGEMDCLTAQPNFTDLGPELADFADTAAVMTHLDLIITTDTAAAHLAGTLLRPTWLLLGFDPDWRWFLEREDSPWYPTLRLLRQPVPGDWETVLTRVERGLETLRPTDLKQIDPVLEKGDGTGQVLPVKDVEEFLS